MKADEGKKVIIGVVAMLVGLIKATSANRAYEEQTQYAVSQAGQSVAE